MDDLAKVFPIGSESEDPRKMSEGMLWPFCGDSGRKRSKLSCEVTVGIATVGASIARHVSALGKSKCPWNRVHRKWPGRLSSRRGWKSKSFRPNEKSGDVLSESSSLTGLRPSLKSARN